MVITRTRQPCGASLPPLHPYGWTCTGRDLITVLRGSEGVAIVVPMHLLDAVMARPEANAFAVEWHPGGDHMHLTLTEREAAYA